ncbi:hypothetical protein Acin_1881 [Acidaminococcus intestini RyC-MR95]|uniref:Uncharacterized protein n=1 Tax=Acidaminococcus intestini (strain RyC-MR95) TaxID=568816 RepID=G4Q425_ACIIR|nr:hypothetical protein Acin_1881 [Acidaminococcus intestini RyC-MR95]
MSIRTLPGKVACGIRPLSTLQRGRRAGQPAVAGRGGKNRMLLIRHG